MTGTRVTESIHSLHANLTLRFKFWQQDARHGVISHTFVVAVPRLLPGNRNGSQAHASLDLIFETCHRLTALGLVSAGQCHPPTILSFPLITPRRDNHDLLHRGHHQIDIMDDGLMFVLTSLRIATYLISASLATRASNWTWFLLPLPLHSTITFWTRTCWFCYEQLEGPTPLWAGCILSSGSVLTTPACST